MLLGLFEAMSYGNYCFVNDIPEYTEVVENRIVTFKKGITGDLCEKLQMLCDDAGLVNEYKSKTPGFLCGKYNWGDVVEQTFEVYRKGVA